MRRRVVIPSTVGEDAQVRAAVVRELEKSQTPDIAVDYFHMRAEDGKIYKITIDSAGAFVLDLVLG
jgi:hypothetical protein